ncbi:hypothetical protein K2X30_05140 [bacterium]|nr:hypothetical protein [bacterium]
MTETKTIGSAIRKGLSLLVVPALVFFFFYRDVMFALVFNGAPVTYVNSGTRDIWWKNFVLSNVKLEGNCAKSTFCEEKGVKEFIQARFGKPNPQDIVFWFNQEPNQKRNRRQYDEVDYIPFDWSVKYTGYIGPSGKGLHVILKRNARVSLPVDVRQAQVQFTNDVLLVEKWDSIQDLKACQKPTDCEIVQKDCCSKCQDEAVNSGLVPQFDARRAIACAEPTTCPAESRNEPKKYYFHRDGTRSTCPSMQMDCQQGYCTAVIDEVAEPVYRQGRRRR